jgi:hypothetical protein
VQKKILQENKRKPDLTTKIKIAHEIERHVLEKLVFSEAKCQHNIIVCVKSRTLKKQVVFSEQIM